MFSIVCVLEGSEFTGQIVEVEYETEFAFERITSVYGHPGRLIYPKGVWKRTTEVAIDPTPTIMKYPGDVH